ncbi:MAG: hypothetical protein OXG42_10060 [Chloroflexi bacterium]|nr:hypothetical protein [Chloroflexota bacterium]
MKEIAITIEGVSPLLIHRFTDTAQMQATSGTRSSIATDSESPHDQAEQALYLDEKGISGIPQPNVFRCIVDAGKFFKAGRSKVTTQKSSIIPACVGIRELFLPIESADGWKVDTRPVRIPATGGRILRHRPCYDDWRLSFTVDLDESLISPKLFREIVDAAGTRIGLGDFRPDTKGPFGKFKVTRWANGE